MTHSTHFYYSYIGFRNISFKETEKWLTEEDRSQISGVTMGWGLGGAWSPIHIMGPPLASIWLLIVHNKCDGGKLLSSRPLPRQTKVCAPPPPPPKKKKNNNNNNNKNK